MDGDGRNAEDEDSKGFRVLFRMRHFGGSRKESIFYSHSDALRCRSSQ